MLIEEARWIGQALSNLPDDAFPLINLGSSTHEFRTESHPWIDAELFGPLRHLERRVVHVDLKSATGVDLVVDFTTVEGQQAVKATSGQSILCSNLFEHLPQDPAISARQVSDLAEPGTILIVTVPRAYPIHADPIDNGYRPTPEELASLFQGTVLAAEEVFCRRMAFYYADFGRQWLRLGIRLCLPFVRPKNWAVLVRTLALRTSASCVVVRL